MTTHFINQINKGIFGPTTVTVGIFDGVHKGHSYMLNILKAKAAETNTQSVVITLWPHPRMVVFPDKEIKLLSTIDEKTELLAKQNIDRLVIIPFSKEFSAIGAKDFVQQILVEKLQVSTLLVGFDNHFGKNKEGNIDLLKQEANIHGFNLLQPAPVFEGRDRISSTDIRLELELGNVDKAAKLLGYQYFLRGAVTEGQKLGRTIGFPTANILTPVYKMVPRTGVYAVNVTANGIQFGGMLNIGFRPTVEKALFHKTIEAHLFNFSGNLYNSEITITFVARLRDEIKFQGLDALTRQLENDKIAALAILNK